jgi:hypothetical protein
VPGSSPDAQPIAQDDDDDDDDDDGFTWCGFRQQNASVMDLE